MVTNYWRTHPLAAGGNIVEDFTHNLRELKTLSKSWVHNKRLLDEQTLRDIEAKVVAMEDEQGRGHTTANKKEKLTTLIAQRSKILKDREENWRLRSRAIWLLEGDDNTKLFYKYANGKKAINTIWHLKNEQGIRVNNLQQLTTLATSHYKQLYKAPPNATLAEII